MSNTSDLTTDTLKSTDDTEFECSHHAFLSELSGSQCISGSLRPMMD